MPRRVLRTTVARIALSTAILTIPACEQSYDRAFDTRVSEPAYRDHGPIVLFDEGHLNSHTTTSGYKPFADLLRSDGYTVRSSPGRLTAAGLEDVAILVLAVAQGANDTNDAAAYSEEEASEIEAWVRQGGSLLLVTDHWPYGAAVSALARRFDVIMGTGLVQDAEHCDAERGDSHLVFSLENKLLHDHPIVRGRNASEGIRSVLTFTGQSLQGPSAAVPFLALSDAAVERPPTPARVERKGGDVRVLMDYGEPRSAAGRSQGIAMEMEAGRMVILGEAGMLRAQRERNGTRVGMNVPGYDNRQLALNIMHWLSRVL